MAIPANAIVITQPIDPADIEIMQVTLQQGLDQILAPSEGVSSFTLGLTAEAAAAGLQIDTTGGRTTTLTGLVLTFWVSVSVGHQSDPLFDGSGTALGLLLTITTNGSPARVKQKTIAITVAQQ